MEREGTTERQTHVSPEHITGVSSDVSSQAEVADLRHPAVSQQNVSGCEIPVDTLHTQTNTEMSTDPTSGFCTEPIQEIQMRQGW